MRRLSCQKNQHIVFWLEGATLARREWISLPYELARESGSRLDPMSLRAECDHLVIGLALRRLARRTVITPRLASIPNSFIKSFLVLFRLVQPGVTTRVNARHIVFLGQINQLFARRLPSHSILLNGELWSSAINLDSIDNRSPVTGHTSQRRRDQGSNTFLCN
jgi:hypothetical protein